MVQTVTTGDPEFFQIRMPAASSFAARMLQRVSRTTCEKLFLQMQMLPANANAATCCSAAAARPLHRCSAASAGWTIAVCGRTSAGAGGSRENPSRKIQLRNNNKIINKMKIIQSKPAQIDMQSVCPLNFPLPKFYEK